MTLNYQFKDGEIYEYDFDFDYDLLEKCLRNMFRHKPSKDELINEFEIDAQDLLDYYNGDDGEPYTRDEVLDYIMNEVDLMDYFEDFLMEYFAIEAREEFEDYEAYRRDPYGYYGISESDFH